jgi:2-polyprenyl-3-methyl-5-hydroxy-6-metoxy-1,4-benzoquinol methylase
VSQPRIGILIVAYNAASTLVKVLDRIPEDFRERVTEVLVSDDYSSDDTYLIGLGYQQTRTDLPITVIRQPHNLGYGGNQKAGYRWAIEQGLDIVVLLHGDGQYAPESLPDLVGPLVEGRCDAVLGSRMMVPGEARRGGMPLYKYVGNRILSTVENAVVGTDLSEWHSGYRAYSVDALREIPFERNADGFSFDTQVIVQLFEAGRRVEEVPIPTYYGDEVCRVNGMGYARDVTRDVLRYRAHKMGFGSGETAFASQAYELKQADDSSHHRLAMWLAARPPGRVLDLGCADGMLGERLGRAGHEVTGVDVVAHEHTRSRLHAFVAGDLEQGIPDGVGGGYDVVLCADILEHVSAPGRLLAAARDRLAPGGVVVVSVPNFAHWYPRARVLLGRFDYDRRGILDSTHLRFFTRRSFERLAGQLGLAVRRREVTGLPLEVLDRSASQDTEGVAVRSVLGRAVRAIDGAGQAVRPGLFGYQLLYELAPDPHAALSGGASAGAGDTLPARAS